MITPGDLFIESDALRPPCFQAETDSNPNGWMLVRHSLAPRQLDKELSATGWTFFYMAGPIRMTAFGSDRIKTPYRALKRAIKAVKQQGCNCLRVESVEIHSFLGIPYITLTVRPRHIQNGILFVGPAGIGAGFTAPEPRYNVLAA